MNEPTFWMQMTYGCDNPSCDNELTFLLEEGCEGPRDGEPLMVRLPDDHPVDPGERKPWPRTASGRLIVPVPFIAGRCPACNADGNARATYRPAPGLPPVTKKVGWLTHVRWNEDRQLDPRPTGIPEAPHFRYPDGDVGPPTSVRDYADQGGQCGRPVYAQGVTS